MPIHDPHVLSLTDKGRREHPEIVGAFNDAPHKVFTSTKQWNTGGIADYSRDTTINGVSFHNLSEEEIKEQIVSMVDNRPLNSEGEPSLLARTMLSEVGGQFSAAALLSIVSKQISVVGLPRCKTTTTKLYANSVLEPMEITSPMSYHFAAPTTQSFDWKTGPQYCVKENNMGFYHVLTEVNGDACYMMLKEGDEQLSIVSYGELLLWKNAIKDKVKPPFEAKPLIEIHATMQLSAGFTVRTQPAVFINYPDINIIVHYPNMFTFCHVLESVSCSPRGAPVSNSGYVPPPLVEGITPWSPPIRPIEMTSGYCDETQGPFYSFHELQLEMLGVYYRWDKVRTDVPSSIAEIRPSMNTLSVPLNELPTVIEAGSSRGPVLLTDDISTLQDALKNLRTSTSTLAASIKNKEAKATQLIEELTTMEQILGTTVVPPLNIFKTKHRGYQTAECSNAQLLGTYALLFYSQKNQGNTPFVHHLKNDVFVAASDYPPVKTESPMLESLHRYTLTRESPEGDVVSNHRLYALSRNRVLSEPCCLVDHPRFPSRTKPFHNLLLSMKHLVREQPQIEIVVPVILRSETGRILHALLVSVMLYRGKLFDLIDNEDPEAAPATAGIHFKIPQKQTPRVSQLFFETSSREIERRAEEDLERIIALVFNENRRLSAHDIQRTIISYTPDHFKMTFALLDVLTCHLMSMQHPQTNSCLSILREVYPYIKGIEEIASSDFAVLQNTDNSIGVAMPSYSHEINQGMPNKYLFQQLQGQIIALREGIGNQKKYLHERYKKIEIYNKRLEEACNLTHQPIDAVRELYHDKAAELQAAEKRIETLSQENACMKQQMQTLHDRLGRLFRATNHSSTLENEPALPAEETPEAAAMPTGFNPAIVDEFMRKLETRLNTLQQLTTARGGEDEASASISP